MNKEQEEEFDDIKCYSCKYGGNKHYNYGFCSGMANYCRKVKKWCSDLKECPLEEANKE